MEDQGQGGHRCGWRTKVREDIAEEGFCYAFFHYDDYDWVDDSQFQELKARFLRAAKELGEYVGVEAD